MRLDKTVLDADSAFIAGDLPETAKVTVQKNTPTFNTFREQVAGWSTYAANVSANIEIRDVKKDFQYEKLKTDKIYSVVLLQYVEGLSELMRLQWTRGNNTMNLNIKKIKPDENGRNYQVLECVADQDSYETQTTTTTTTTT